MTTNGHRDLSPARRIALVATAGLAAVAMAACSSQTTHTTTQAPAKKPVVTAPDTAKQPAPAEHAGEKAQPASTGSKTGTKSARDSLPPPRLRLGPWTSKPARTLPGALYLTESPFQARPTLRILSYGKLRTATIQGPMLKNDCVQESLVVSPDGTSVAWVEGDMESANAPRRLVVAPIAEGAARTVATGVECTGGPGPKWMPDSGHLLMTRRDGTVASVDVRTGAVQPRPKAWASYVAWSHNGAFMTYREGRKIVVATATGTVVRRLPYVYPSEPGGFSVQAISNDGRYVGVNFENTDPQTVRGAAYIVDTVTGKNVAPPIKAPAGGWLANITWLWGGQMIIASGVGDSPRTAHLVSASGKEIASAPFPNSLHMDRYFG